MQTFTQTSTLQNALSEMRETGKKIGFVPTMGALHEGHLSLVEQACTENDLVVCSIFVNPMQFNNIQDLHLYPRTLEEDRKLLSAFPKVWVFTPDTDEMYPTEPRTKLNFGALDKVLEGTFRPGHFSGVGIVVARLFHLVNPHRAYFGQKDLQQCLIIQQMVQDFAFPVEIVICPTKREADGLAMSSRNRRLGSNERQMATIIYRSLQKAVEMLKSGTSIEVVNQQISDDFENSNADLEYFSIADGASLEPLEEIQTPQKIALCIAVFVGRIRLIDNIILNLD